MEGNEMYPVDETDGNQSGHGSSPLKQAIGKALFFVAQSDISRYFIGFSFEHFGSFLPVKKLLDNNEVIAFKHPVQFWEKHNLIVPKKAIRSLMHIDMRDRSYQETMIAIFQGAQMIINTEEFTSYALLVNGGDYQDVPQMHFHLAMGNSREGIPIVSTNYKPQKGEIIQKDSKITVYNNAQPQHAVDMLLVDNNSSIGSFPNIDFDLARNQEDLIDVLSTAQNLVRDLNLRAFTLSIDSTNDPNESAMQFRLVSGDRLGKSS